MGAGQGGGAYPAPGPGGWYGVGQEYPVLVLARGVGTGVWWRLPCAGPGPGQGGWDRGMVGVTLSWS